MNISLPVSASDKTLLGALPTAIYVTDADGCITYYNPAAAELWGVKPEIGSAQWCGSWRLYDTDGALLPHDQCPMAITLRTGEPVRGIEAIAERPDGSRVRFLPFPTPLKDDTGKVIGAINLLMDVTQHHRAEVNSQRLASIVSSSDDAIVSKTLDGKITYWNASAARIFGYDESEMVGQNIMKIIPPELHDEERHVLRRLQQGERIDHYETIRVGKDGRRIDISLTVSPMRDRSGRVIGASKVARDISDRKHAEKSQLLLMGELSHRVKNTLATVQAIVTQSLRRSPNPEEFVTSFTGRIISLARAHDLLSETRWEGIDLSALVRDQVLLGIPDERITQSGPAIVLDPQPALHLAMVLHELGTNARKYGSLTSPRGRLSIDWQIATTRQGRELRLVWKESGGPKVVVPRQRGFGTTLVEESLMVHGGHSEFDYQDSGVKCELKLPLPKLRELSGAYHLPLLAPGLQDRVDRERLHGKRILIVEDEPLIAMEIEAILRDAGCDVVGPVGDLEEAKKLAVASDLDAALLDTNLGGKRVDSLAAALVRSAIPFAFVTGYGVDGLPLAFRDAIMIPKPFTKQQMISALAALFGRRAIADANLLHLPRSGRQE